MPSGRFTVSVILPRIIKQDTLGKNVIFLRCTTYLRHVQTDKLITDYLDRVATAACSSPYTTGKKSFYL